MELAFGLAIFGVLLVFGVLSNRRTRRADAILKRASRAHGLRAKSASGRVAATGEVDGVPTLLRLVPGSSDTHELVLFRAIETESRFSPGGGARFVDDVLRWAHIDDELAALIALLTPDLRQLLTRADVGLDCGDLRLRLPEDGELSEAKVAAVMAAGRDAVAIVAQARAGSVAERLGRMSLHDPMPPWRRAATKALLQRFPGTQEAVRAQARALASEDPHLIAVAVATLASDDGVAPASALLERPNLPPEVAESMLRQLSTWRRSPSEAALGRCLAATDEVVLQLALSALDAAAMPRHQAAVVAQLSSQHEARIVAAAGALGRWGDLAAVAHLKPLTDGFGTSDIKAACADAVARIQARLGGTRGELALSEVDTGQLALADEEPVAHR